MKLGIPTLNRYDLLTKLIVSAEAGTVTPEKYIIVDNGGSYAPPEHLKAKVDVIRPGSNIGVSASWNRILLESEGKPIAISNDDIVFNETTFAKLSAAALENDFVGACGGWALFAQSERCATEVGMYDEHFYPAYYEDCDYLLRLKAAGIPVFDLGHIATHQGEQSTAGATDAQRAEIAEGRDRNYAYFVAKWGSDSPRWGNPHVENYAEPFNGKFAPPIHPGYGTIDSEFFRNERTKIAPLRWDVLNFIAKIISAERYLEIGVADGSCMRRIEISNRWGVDPNPQDGAVRASTVFTPRTSDFFFEHVAPNAGKFDLIFIDGDHRAEQVYREVQSALKCLSPQGVIVLHDCNPHTEAMQQVPLVSGWQWTGDVWKAIAKIRAEGEVECRVIPSDYGIGLVLPTDKVLKKVDLPCDYDRLLWRDLKKDREYLLGLLLPGIWMEWLEARLLAKLSPVPQSPG